MAEIPDSATSQLKPTAGAETGTEKEQQEEVDPTPTQLAGVALAVRVPAPLRLMGHPPFPPQHIDDSPRKGRASLLRIAHQRTTTNEGNRTNRTSRRRLNDLRAGGRGR